MTTGRINQVTIRQPAGRRAKAQRTVPSLDQFSTKLHSALQEQGNQHTTFNRPSLSNSPISERAPRPENEVRHETKLLHRGRFRFALLLTPCGARQASTLSTLEETTSSAPKHPSNRDRSPSDWCSTLLLCSSCRSDDHATRKKCSAPTHNHLPLHAQTVAIVHIALSRQHIFKILKLALPPIAEPIFGAYTTS